MKVIIFEGTDLVGKTALIEKIGKELNGGIVLKNSFRPNSIEDDSQIQYQYMIMADLIKEISKSKFYHKMKFLFLDRFYQSQLVYSYLRGKDDLDYYLREESNFYSSFEFFLSSLSIDIKYVWVTDWRKNIRRRFKEFGDEHIHYFEWFVLNDRYNQYFKACILNKTKVFSSSIEDIEGLKLWIKND